MPVTAYGGSLSHSSGSPSINVVDTTTNSQQILQSIYAISSGRVDAARSLASGLKGSVGAPISAELQYELSAQAPGVFKIGASTEVDYAGMLRQLQAMGVTPKQTPWGLIIGSLAAVGVMLFLFGPERR